MEPLILILVLLGSSAATGFIFGFVRAHLRHRKQPTIDQLDAQRVTMEAEQATKEDGWIADLEDLVALQKANLAHLRAAPPTIENLNARGEAVISIGGAERALYTLRARKNPQINDRRKSAAVNHEGRT